MKRLYGVFLFIGVFALNNASSPTTLKRIATDQLLMQHLMRASRSNPSLALECFELYTPVFNAILQQFSSSYERCITNAQSQTDVLNKEATANQTLISTSAQGVCNKMIACSDLDSLQFFDCYGDEGSENSKTLYGLTNTAIDVAAYLREGYYLVETDKKRCENASERAYVKANNAVTDALNYCLENGPPGVVTATAAPVETTTKAEITSTEESPTTILPQETIEATAAPEGNGFEEEDLSRSAPLTFLNKHKKLGRV